MSKSTSPESATLTDQGTLNSTIKVLEQSFDLSADGYLCQTRDLYRILVKAAAEGSTIEAACNDSPGAPAGNTVRGYLNQQLLPAQIRELEQRSNRALYHRWPHDLWSRPLEIAFDLHDECYYGDYDDDDPNCWVCKGQKRAGTHHFYRCATASMVRHGVRFTLAVVFVHPDDETVTVVEKLVKTVRSRGLRIGCLYADKGFCSIAVLRDLRRHTQYSAIIAVPRKGEQGGVKALCHGRCSYFSTHTFQNGQAELTVEVAVVRAYKQYRHHPRRATWLVYALIRVRDTLSHIRERYRGRFGIDTGYRSMEQVRARTCSPNPALRFFLMGLALILVNVWVTLRCRFRSATPQAALAKAWRRFTLEQMARFLIRAVEAVYGVVKEINPANL